MRKEGGLKLVMTEEMASGSYAAHVTDEMAFTASMPFMPHVMREMTSAEYWISKVRDPDRVLADEGQIKALNKEIVGVPGCHLRDMPATNPNVIHFTIRAPHLGVAIALTGWSEKDQSRARLLGVIPK